MSNPLQDQYDAAVEDARRRLHNVPGDTKPVMVDLRADSEQGPAERMLAHVLGHYIADGEATAACPHVIGAPQVVFGAAAFPEKVFCHDCFKAAWGLYSGMWEKFGCFTPCDNCHGKPVPGSEEGSSTGIVNVGPIMLTISLCAQCTRMKDGGD